MNSTQPEYVMNNVEQVIQDPLRFKLKLDIGEQAYTSLRLKSYLSDSVDAGYGAAAGMAVAQSSLVASTFFAKTGFLGALGIGAAVTPVGWAVAAGVAGAGLSVVLGKYFIRNSSSRAKTIPEFINTPLDVLATGLFDMIAMLGIKLASIDGTIDYDEREFIKAYFVKEWGYDETFVAEGLTLIESKADEYSIKEISEQLARFKKENPDCNYKSMSNEIISFITGIAEADGIFDEREEMAIARVHQTFEDVNSFSTAFSETTKTGMEELSRQSKSAIEGLSSGFEATKRGFSSFGEKSKTVFSRFARQEKDDAPQVPPDVS